jgi:uncharacterized protein (TIGR02301 family)
MRIFALVPRPLALILASACALSALAALAPAQAQFFFPFFDNRPTKRPDTDFWGRPRQVDDQFAPRPRPKPHKEKPKPGNEAKPKAPESAKGQTVDANAAPIVEGPPPPYEPQLLRLSEIMGALAYLQTVCASSGDSPAPTEAAWRAQMENLMTAEGAGPSRREKLAGAYNRGLQGYAFSYRVCTPNAQLARKRFLDEGAQLAHDISTRYRAN